MKISGGLQVGGGINTSNALTYIEEGASHVIVTSVRFNLVYFNEVEFWHPTCFLMHSLELHISTVVMVMKTSRLDFLPCSHLLKLLKHPFTDLYSTCD